MPDGVTARQVAKTMSDSVVSSSAKDSATPSRRGQSLVEFGILLPLLLMLVGGIAQYGIVFAARHSLIQVARDTGRWAATQTFDPCRAASLSPGFQPAAHADLIAQQSRLLGYVPGAWGAGTLTVYPDNGTLPAAPPRTEGIEVVWTVDSGNCPPRSPTDVAWVTVRLTHQAPVVLPGFAYLPDLGTCDGTGCYLAVSATARFRMEVVASP